MKNIKLKVNTGNSKYKIIIGSGIVDKLSKILKENSIEFNKCLLVIDKGLLSNEYTSLDWDSYIFRILNLTNKNRRLDVLPELDKIYSIIFNNGRVKTLKTTQEAFDVALEVYRVILNNVLPLPEVTADGEADLQEMLNDLETENYHRERKGLEPLSPEDVGIDIEMGGDSLLVDDVNGGHTPPDSSVEMTDRQKKQLENWKKKQQLNF